MFTLEEKEEVQALLKAFNRASIRRRSRLFFFLQIGPGCVATAIFTMLAFLFSAISLGAINTTVFEIVYTDLPAIGALIKLRTSLQAQERFASNYYILQDPDYLALFRQREKEIVASLRILQQTGSSLEHIELQRLYANYQAAASRLWTGNRENSDELRASATELFKSINDLYLKRQAKLHSMIDRADDRRSTLKWTLAISCTGFMLTVWIASFVINRILGAMRRLQMATHRAMTADFICPSEIPAYAEFSDLADDITNLMRKVTELERLNFAATRYTGDVTTERILEERLKEGTSYAFCDARIDELNFVAAMQGYAIATDLLRLTAYLLHVAVRNHGGPGSFVSHAGGDSFLIILPPDKVQPFCEAAITSFDAEVHKLFNVEERASDKVDTHCSVPITTITITALICGVNETTSVSDITRGFDTMVEKKARTSVGSRWERATLPLLTIFLAITFVAGCTTERISHGGSPFSRITDQDAVGTTSATTLSRKQIMSRQLAQAVRALERGDVPGAKKQLKAICNKSPVAGVTDEAMFRLALLYLRPNSDTAAAERGEQLLKRLKKKFPRSNWTMQAESLRELIYVAKVQRGQNRSLTSANDSLTSELAELTKKLKDLKHLDIIELEAGTR